MENREEYYFSEFPRTPFEVFTVIYGVLFINLFDCLFPRILGYHLLLLIVYVAPYIPLFFMRKINLYNLIWIGVLISLFNDLFFFFIARLLGARNFELLWYYSNWLIPQTTYLGLWDFLFFKLKVYSWTMATSIYARIVFLWLTKNWRPEMIS